MARVSVVMPLYNAENYIEETLKSIINQTYEDFEIVIVDDASIDNSINIIKSMNDSRIRLFQNDRNRGIAYTRNRAISLSRGNYIALMDDDDIAPNYRLEKEVEFLDSNLDIDAVGGHCRFIDSEGKQIANKQWNVFQNPLYIKAYLLTGDAVPNGSAMIRKNFIKDNSLRYLDGMYGAEDYRFWVECSLYGKIGMIDQILLYWRIGHDNETKRVSKVNGENRKKVLEEIRSYAFEQNGIFINQGELQLFNKIFDEDGIISNQEEMQFFYQTLKSIVHQAREKELENAKEIEALCRKRFGEKVGKAFYLWQ